MATRAADAPRSTIGRLERPAITGVLVREIGESGGHSLMLRGETPISLEELRKTHESWLPAYMAGEL